MTIFDDVAAAFALMKLKIEEIATERDAMKGLAEQRLAWGKGLLEDLGRQNHDLAKERDQLRDQNAKLIAERDELKAQLDKLEAKFVCGHRKADMDNSYGECMYCSIVEAFHEAEANALEAQNAKLVEVLREVTDANCMETLARTVDSCRAALAEVSKNLADTTKNTENGAPADPMGR